MREIAQFTGDVMGAATFMGGLILVYLRALVTGYGSYETDEKADVKTSYMIRAWGSFVAFLLAIATVGFAMAAEWYASFCYLQISIGLLFAVFACALIAAFMTAWEIE